MFALLDKTLLSINRVRKGLQGQKKRNFRETVTGVDVLKKKLIESQETRELYKNECETSGLTIERRKMCRR